MLKMLKLTIVVLLIALLNAGYATTPAKPGVVASPRVIEFSQIMSASYTESGLARRMERVKSNQSSAGLREDITLAFPVIVAHYTDMEADSATIPDLQRELFDGPWPSVTMAEHYEEMSYGQFHLEGQVYGWYSLDHDAEFYEGSQTEPFDNGFFGPPGGVADFLFESLTQADIEIDFSQFDNDGDDGIPNSGDDDGYVDATFFVHSGRGGEGGGPGIWSHRWVYSGFWGNSFVTNDAREGGGFIRVNDYIMQPAVSTGGGLIEIGVFSHEFGHALGLPDLYDTDYSSDGIGDWCLMGGGSWNSPTSPAHLSAWCKEMLGWVTPVFPDDNVLNMEIPNVEENPFVLKLWTHGETDMISAHYPTFTFDQDVVGREYFLVENRQRLGTDIHLTEPGLLVWHIDNSRWTNSNDSHRMVELKGADGLPGNGDSSGDPFPGSSDNHDFDYLTSPAATAWNGQNTEVALLNISASDTVMYADVEVYETVPHLRVTEVMVLDMNNNSILEADEAVEIWLEVENSGGMATGVTAMISTTSAQVEVTEDLIEIEDIPFMETGFSHSGFEFIVGDISEPAVISFDIHLSSIENTIGDSTTINIGIGPPEVLVIDDDGVEDGPDDYAWYYRSALDTLGLVYQVWDLAANGMPDQGYLDRFPKLVWYSGDADSPLNAEKIDLLENYLDQGGRLLITGQNISSGLQDVDAFLMDYLGANVVHSSVERTFVYGVDDHALTSGDDLYILRAMTSASNQAEADVISAVHGGEALFHYPLYPGEIAGVSKATSEFRSVYLAVGFEAMTPLQGEAVRGRAELLERIFNWLDLSTVSVHDALTLPESAEISKVYPNPFNPSLSIDLRIPDAQEVALQILDLAGREVESLSVTGRSELEWQPSVDAPAGVYFLRLLQDGVQQGEWTKVTYLK